jgi:hypothetical protein
VKDLRWIVCQLLKIDFIKKIQEFKRRFMKTQDEISWLDFCLGKTKSCSFSKNSRDLEAIMLLFEAGIKDGIIVMKQKKRRKDRKSSIKRSKSLVKGETCNNSKNNRSN